MINSMSKILVVDIETDNINTTKGSIIEIGIVEIDPHLLEISGIPTGFIINEGNIIDRNAWIFSHSTLQPEDIEQGIPLDDSLKFILNLIFEFHWVTAYNQQFDFNWLISRGIKIPNRTFDPMIILTDIMKLPHFFYDHKYPKVEEAYKFLFDEKIEEPHRALGDAIIEAKIIIKLLEKYISYDKQNPTLMFQKYLKNP